jgi:hypothetical protein
VVAMTDKPPQLDEGWWSFIGHDGIEKWLELQDSLRQWRNEWDAGIVQIRLSDGRTMLLDDAVPDTRAECPTVKPCPHVRCRAHLWRVDSQDRAGRPGLASVPRDRRGLTLPVLGNLSPKRAGTTLEARWLETPVPPSCALDCADKGPMSNEQIGEALSRHRTLIGKDVPDAMESAKAKAAELGMSEADLIAGLRELGREKA